MAPVGLRTTVASKAKASKAPGKGRGTGKGKAAPAKAPKKAKASKAPAPAAVAPATPKPTAQSPPAQQGWQPVGEEPAWVPVAPPRSAFDPATGAWLSTATGSAWRSRLRADPSLPEARKPTSGSTAWTVLLGLDLAFLAVNFLAQLAIGSILLFAPDSAAAQEARDTFGAGSARAVALGQLLTFTLMGVLPFLWVLATRRATWEGTKRYLQLHSPGGAVLRGILLTPALLLGVALLLLGYTLITEGPQGLDLAQSEEGENPAVDALLANLTWPLAILVAATSGIGEEILFRGVLRRWLGSWGQALLFGLSHMAGGFLPQVLFALGLGLLFGWLLRRGWSLWSMMVAHALYNMSLLALSLVYG